MQNLVRLMRRFEKKKFSSKRFYRLFLDVHGVGVEIVTDNKWLVRELKKEYEEFLRKECNPILKIYVFSGCLPIKRKILKKMRKNDFIKPSYFSNKIIIIEYADAKVVYDNLRESVMIFMESNRKSSWYEIAYHYVESRVGELLEKRGIFRIHGASLLKRGKCILLVGGAESGKTTLLLLLSKFGGKILSDDVSFVTEKLDVLPNPTRIGMTSNMKLNKVGGELSRIEYSSGVVKYLAKPSDLGLRVYKGKCKISYIFILNNRKIGVCKILKASYLRISLALLRNLLIGFGITQLREILFVQILTNPLSFLLRELRRLKMFLKLISFPNWYVVYTSKNPSLTAKTIEKFLKSLIHKGYRKCQ